MAQQFDPEMHRQMGVEADVVLRVGMLLMGAGTSGSNCCAISPPLTLLLAHN